MSIRFSVNPTAGGADASFFFDPANLPRHLSDIEDAGFSSVIVEDGGGMLPNLDISAALGRASSALAVFATHWAGVIQPVVAARQFAYLDHLLGGRIGLNVVIDSMSGRMSHEAACRRTHEYLTLLKRLWSNEAPFDHEGEFYRIRDGLVPEKGPQGWAIPIRMSGRSGTAIQVAALHASTFDVDADNPANAAALIETVRRAASARGRSSAIRFSTKFGCASLHRALQTETASPGAALARLLRPYVDAGVTEILVCGGTPTRMAAFLVRSLPEFLGVEADGDRPHGRVPANCNGPARWPLN